MAKTRQPYGYVGDNPLNGTDPSGLCGNILWSITPALCVLEVAAPYLANTPAAGPLTAAANAGATAVGAVQEHATFGFAGCLVVCGNAEVQGGVAELQFGGVGWIDRGPYVGWANKPTNSRSNTSLVVAGCWGLGIASTAGYPGGNLPGDKSDWEVDTAIGVGGQYGPMQTTARWDLRPALNWLGRF